MRSITKLLLCTLALQLSGQVAAREARFNPDHRWYQADVIVFRHTRDTSGEAWPAIQHHSWPTSAINLKPVLPKVNATPLPDNLLEPVTPPLAPVPADIARDAYIRLPAGEQVLSRQQGILNRSNQYQVLAQAAWRMPVDASLQDIPVKIRASGNGSNGYLLEGTVTVSASRFLHVDADFWLNELTSEGIASNMNQQKNSFDAKQLLESGEKEGRLINLDNQDNPVRIARNFHLQQRRRIRNSSEVLYLDSPVIGVLFKLTPYERPQTILEVNNPGVTQR